MTTFNVAIRGEDHTEFVIEVDASDVEEAREEAEELYPDGSVLEVYDPQERAEDLYRRAERLYDDPYHYDDYDY